MTHHLPASQRRTSEFYRQGQANDPTVSKVIAFCQSGWPHRLQISEDLKLYWASRGELSLHDNLLLYGSCIIVPSKLRKETLAKIHRGHQGIQRCQACVMTSVWGPGVGQVVETYVKHCSHCQKKYVPPNILDIAKSSLEQGSCRLL